MPHKWIWSWTLCTNENTFDTQIQDLPFQFMLCGTCTFFSPSSYSWGAILVTGSDNNWRNKCKPESQTKKILLCKNIAYWSGKSAAIYYFMHPMIQDSYRYQQQENLQCKAQQTYPPQSPVIGTLWPLVNQIICIRVTAKDDFGIFVSPTKAPTI